MKKFKLSLLTRILIALVCGILLGGVLPQGVVRVFVTFNSLFGNFLSFSIPLIILGLVTPAIGNLGKGAGRLLLITTLIAYGSTLFSGFFTYFSCAAIFPDMLQSGVLLDALSKPESSALKPFFTVEMPPLMGVMTALLLSFLIGMGLSSINGTALRDGFRDFGEIVKKLIEHLLVPLLPFYIFGVFLSMSVHSQMESFLGVFMQVIIVIFALHVLLLFIQFGITGAICRKNPLRMLWNMLPAYATALGTQSSAATIPVTMKQAVKNGVDEDVATFTVPLCATIHLAGSTMKIVACSMAIMVMTDMPIPFSLFAGFIVMLGITMVAAPGVPGGAIMAALGVLHTMLGFTDAHQSMMIVLYIVMDSFGTACNVTGDGAIAMLVHQIKLWGVRRV